MAIELTPIDDIETPVGGNSEHAALITDLNALPTKAASFPVPFVGDALKKYKKALQTAANRFELSVRFGIDTPDPSNEDYTIVQAKLVAKQAAAGRPTVGPSTEVEDTTADETAVEGGKSK